MAPGGRQDEKRSWIAVIFKGVANFIVGGLAAGLVVSFLTMNAQDTAGIRNDTLGLVSRIGYVAREGIDPDVQWEKERRQDSYIEMDGKLADLKGRLAEDLWLCAAGLVGTAKTFAASTSLKPAETVAAFDADLQRFREDLDDWRTAETFRLGWWRTPIERECGS